MKYYDLTNPQKSIWSMEQFYKGTNINNICGTLTIKQKTDLDTLNKAINIFVQNNKSFGLNFKEKDGKVVQYFNMQVEKSYECVNLKNYTEVQKFAKQLAEEVFDIYSECLYKFILFKLENGHGGFIVLTHHIISDAATFSLIGTEIVENYRKLIQNEQIETPNFSYEDYIKSEIEYMNSSKFTKDKEYWTSLYKDVPELASIPESCVNLHGNSNGKSIRKEFVICEELLSEIVEFCKKEKLSNFNFFMAIYAIYLGKVSNLNDFVIGTPILNRSNFSEKHTTGMFINTAPLRINLANSLSFIQFAKQIAQNSLSMLRYQKYPYEMLLENLRTKNSNLPTLFDIMLSYQITKAHDKNIDIPYEVEWLPATTISNGLCIHLHDNNDIDNLNVAYDYQIDRYNENDIDNIHKRILHIISQVLENENLLNEDIEIVTLEEKQKILYNFNNTTLDYEKTKTVIDYFEEQVKKSPKSTALVFEDQTFSYAELNNKANRLASYLTKNNVKPKDIVGIMMHRSPEMIISILAILKIGGTYLPIDPEYPIDRINYMLNDSNTRTILIHSKTLDLEIDADCEKFNVDLDSNIFDDSICKNTNYNINPSDLIYLIYTSGSTGKPKGVMINHQNIANFILGEKEHIDFSPDKVFVSVTTFCFDIFALEIWGALTSGMKLVLANDTEQVSAKDLKSLCEKHCVNMIQTTPSRFSILFDYTEDLNFWNQFSDIMVGGEPFPKNLLEKFQKNTNANIYNMYGPTETTVWSTIKDLSSSSSITIGKPIANTTCYILDSNKNLLPVGVPGTLYIGGDGVSFGYWNRKDLTDEKFIKSPFKEDEIIYNTGDLAYISNDFELVHLGRCDFQVKIRGYRIELGEIEQKILEFKDITDCVVNSIDNGSKLCAYYISNSEINISDLRSYLSSSFPVYMVPNYFVRMDSFPHTPNGKIDKKAFPIPSLDKNKDTISPRNDVDKYLIQELENSLKINNISITDSFFEIGGDSLVAIKLCTKISSKYHINLVVKDIFENPIIQDLSDIIASKSNTKVSTITKAIKRDYYHISSAQKRVYFSSIMSENDKPLYNMPGVITFDKKPDISRLNECFKKLIEKHSSLRTYFEVIDGEVYQKVLPTLSFKIDEVFNKDDLSMEEIVNQFVKPFDLSKAPLFRACFVNQNDHYLLLFDIHHIICDGSSLSVFTKELSDFYNMGSLSKLPFDYVDYSEWEFERLKNNDFDEDKEFWLNTFKDGIPTLDLQTDYIRPSIQSFEGSKVYKTIDPDLALEINNLAKKFNVSPFMLLLSCFYVLLFKYSSKEDIVCGTPVINRNTVDLLDMIGMFVNTLALKNHIEYSMSFKDFVNSVKANCIKAFDHQSYPFDELVNNLDFEKDTSKSPLFQTMFTYQNDGFAPLSFDDINTDINIPDIGISKFDLSLEVIPQDNGEFNLSFEYCTKLFKKSTIERLSSHFINIIKSVLQNTNTKISDIDILSKEEKYKILYDFNDTKMNYPKDKTIIQLFEEQAQKTPNNIAVVFDDKKLTYKELNQKANTLATDLIKHNVKYKDVVGVLLPRSIEFVISIFAILKCGATYMPLFVDYPNDRINYMIQNSHSKLILTNNVLKDKLQDINAIIVDDFHSINSLEVLDRAPSIPSDIAYIIYTSGSTGKPKGVQITHNCLNNFVHSFDEYFSGVTEHDNFLASTNISFDVSIFELFLPLLKGASLILYHEELIKDILDYCNYIINHEITGLYIPPNILNEVYFILKDKKNLKINKLLVGVEAIRKETLDKYFLLNPDMKIVNGYGPTETTICSTALSYTKDLLLDRDIVPIGKALHNNNIYILDSNKNVLPIGIAGELYVTGNGVGAGYINNQAETDKNYLPNIFDISSEKMYKTGDIGKWNDDGTISLVGRKDNQIKISGYRIELDEIDSAIMSYPDIQKSITIVLDIRNKKRLISYFIASKDIKEQDILSYLNDKLTFYMIPYKLVCLDSFPLTSNGKIDKKALPMPIFEDECEYIKPETETQEKLQPIWSNLFNLDKISIDENFFHIGGDSLLCIKLTSRIYDEFNIEIDIKQIFNNPSIRSLANLIDSLSSIGKKMHIERQPQKDLYPTSSAQKRTYLSSKMDEDSTLYNIYGGMLLDSMPDIHRLQNAINEIILRHEPLRTHFEMYLGQIVQKIENTLNVQIDVQDVNTNDPDVLFYIYVSTFNLNKLPLFNVVLFKLPNGKALLMLDVHHIIFDGTSLNNLMQEISCIYNGDEPPKLDISYKDFASWEEEELSNNGFAESKKFWLEQFSSDIPVLDLPTTFPRPTMKSYEGNTLVTSISKELTEKINNFASKNNVTPYMVMLSCYYILLHKYTDEKDIVVGSPVSGRLHRELEPLLGMFVNSVPLRQSMDSSMNFKSFLENVRNTCINAFEHQDYPFDLLVNDLKIAKDTSRHPLFDTMFIYQNNGFLSCNFDGIKAKYRSPNAHSSKFDISLEVFPSEDTLKLSFEYCTKLFDEIFINNFAKYYKNILNVVLEQSDIAISDISLLGEDEKYKILNEFNTKKVNYPRDKTIIQLFEEQVNRVPNNIAVVFGDTKLTYKELSEKVNSLALYLKVQNVGHGDIVCMLFDKSLEMIVSILAILKLGACYLPIDINYPRDRIDYIINDSHTKIALSTKNITLDLPSSVSILHVDLDNEDIYGTSLDFLDVKDTSSEDIAYIMYTSGSTGRPKGVMVKNINVVRLVKNTNFIEFSDEERILQTGSIVFDACTFEIWGALLNGFELYIIKKEELLDSSLFADYLLKNKITILWLTAPLFNQLCENNPHMFDSVHYLLTGGDILSPRHINMVREAAPNLTIINGYGPTENTTFSTCFTIDKTYKTSIPIGKPISGSTAYVVSSTGSLLPIGFSGELWVGGDGVASGYFNNPDLTHDKFIKNPFGDGMIYKTGDIVKWLPDGNIDFVGRVDNQVKIRGFRVELSEINNTLSNFNNIKDCITIICEMQNKKTICSYFTSNDNTEINESLLRDFLKEYLPNYMIPTYLCQLDKFPLTANGKIDKKLLPKPRVNVEKENFVAPSTKLELQIASIFQNLLSISPIGIDDNFFELGGDSLLAVNLQIELLKLDLKITYSDIFMHPTIRELETKLSSGNDKSSFSTLDASDFEKFNAILDNTTNLPLNIEKKEIGNVIIAGTTGFLGAHILDSFLKSENGNAYCLVRSGNRCNFRGKIYAKIALLLWRKI